MQSAALNQNSVPGAFEYQLSSAEVMASSSPLFVCLWIGMGFIWDLAHVRSWQLKQRTSCLLRTPGIWCTPRVFLESIHAVTCLPSPPYGGMAAPPSSLPPIRDALGTLMDSSISQKYQTLEAVGSGQKDSVDSGHSQRHLYFSTNYLLWGFQGQHWHSCNQLWPALWVEEDQALMLNPIWNKF